MSDVLEAHLRSNRTQTTQSDSPMTKVDRSTYGGFSNKLSKGTPNQYFVQRFIDHVSIQVYPTPDSTNASKDMHFYYIKRIQDIGDYTNATDVPFRFVPCMISGLAFYLAQKYQPQLIQQMKLYYEDEFARALAEDGSASSTHITPKSILSRSIMAKYATGKYAKAISDRSGMEFPYKEMLREWNGSLVHVSEYEAKQPQLEPKPHGADGIALRNVRTDRVEPAVAVLLGNNPFSTTASSTTVTVTENNHGRTSGDTVRFRNVQGSPGGVAFTAYEDSSGFSITVTTTNKYTFTLGSTPSITEEGGGPTVTAGPVTITP